MMTTLEFTTHIPATPKQLFEFHLDITNVRIITPPFIRIRFASKPDIIRQGSCITVEIKQFGIWLPWEITIEQLHENSSMTDRQTGKGPFSYWKHEHLFSPSGTGTLLTDRLSYQLPFGRIGKIFDALLFRHVQRWIFRYRHKKTAEYFSK